MDKPPPDLSHSAEEVGVFDAKTRLSELLDRVASGEEYVITKHGTPVARLVPAGKNKPDPRRAKAALKSLKAAARKAVIGRRLTREETREAKELGRM